MGLRSLPALLIQTLNGVIALRPRVLKVDTTNLTLTDNGDSTVTLGATGGGAFVGARCTLSTDQTIAVSSGDALTPITWDVETYDTSAIHSTLATTSRFVVPGGMTGYWAINVVLNTFGHAGGAGSGIIVIALVANGASTLGTATQVLFKDSKYDPSKDYVYSSGATLNLTAGDYVEIGVYNAIGESVDIGSSANYSTVEFIYRGA